MRTDNPKAIAMLLMFLGGLALMGWTWSVMGAPTVSSVGLAVIGAVGVARTQGGEES